MILTQNRSLNAPCALHNFRRSFMSSSAVPEAGPSDEGR